MSTSEETVNVRMWRKTRDRLKIKGVRAGRNLMEIIDDISKK